MRPRFHRFWFPLAALAFLPGCSLILGTIGAPTLRELRIERAFFIASEADLTPAIRSLQPYDNQLSPSVMVSIATRRDLDIYEKDYSSTFFLSASLCTDGAFDPMRQLSTGYVFIEPLPPADLAASGKQDGFRYRTYLRFGLVTRHPSQAMAALTSPYPRTFVAHDLRLQNDDICFNFSGGAMLGGSHRSVDFVLPYAVIAQALAEAGLPHAPLAASPALP